MIKFNPLGKESLTAGECLEPAMEIKNKKEAMQYKRDYIAYIQADLDKNPNELTAEQIANSNLGYFAGYYSNEVRKRVEELFECAHPIFGSIKQNGAPTAAQAFRIGQERAEKNKQR